ncbi:MAG: ECF transporter S component [Ruminiclostridium sp.]
MIVIKSERLRSVLKLLIPFAVIPLLALFGVTIAGGKSYLIISLTAVALSLLLFIAGFDKRKTGSRRMVIAAIMIALCVVGRFIPFFKPITAITVISAVYLGSETGFLVGSLSAFISNFYFGQGPWTPFQMLSWGLIGFIGGCLGKYLKKSKPLLLIYGVLSGVAYSFIMDIWTVLGYGDGFNPDLYLAAIVTALPYTILYSVSNFVFLFFLEKPFGEKLERIKLKYGI